MKKYYLGIIAAISLVVVVAGINSQQNFVAQEGSNREISLKIGEREIKTTYEKLGISVNKKEGGTYELASVFSAVYDGQNKIASVASIDTKILGNAVVSVFPFLTLPEDAQRSFFITSADQKIMKTFNLRKLAAQLKESAENLDKRVIEIEVINEDLSAKKEELAGKEVVIKLEGDDVPTLEWKISADIALDRARLEEFLQNEIAQKVNRSVQNASIKQFVDEGKAVRAEVYGVAQYGVSVPVKENVEMIKNAVLSDKFEVFLQLQFEPSYIYNETDYSLGDMKLLATGRSNFAGSPEGRAFNIRKGLNEKITNIIIPTGAQFSFNNFVGQISRAAGWQEALGIFNGKDLIPTLGGGLCQVSTTVYRAALLAGLQIVERKPHSLYVSYYKKFGEGLDATVFSNGPDLIFTNNTPSYIFIQSYVEGDDSYVKIYGTSDGRMATLQGPYRSHDIPQEKNYIPPRNEIVWFRNIQWADGNNQEEMITSRYNSIPSHPAR